MVIAKNLILLTIPPHSIIDDVVMKYRKTRWRRAWSLLHACGGSVAAFEIDFMNIANWLAAGGVLCCNCKRPEWAEGTG